MSRALASVSANVLRYSLAAISKERDDDADLHVGNVKDLVGLVGILQVKAGASGEIDLLLGVDSNRDPSMSIDEDQASDHDGCNHEA